MADENKKQGPMGRLGALGKKKKQTLGQKQFETYKSELDTQFDKGQRIQKTYEGASPKIKEDLKKRFKGVFNPKEMVASSRRDAAKTFAKGGSAKKKKRGAAIRGRSKILR